jgi:hypothetical protein
MRVLRTFLAVRLTRTVPLIFRVIHWLSPSVSERFLGQVVAALLPFAVGEHVAAWQQKLDCELQEDMAP